MRNVWNKSRRENQNTCCFTSNNFFSENFAIYLIMSKNVVEPERPQMAMWRCVACWISKATRAQAHAIARAAFLTRARTRTRAQKYVILIAFPR